MSKHPRQPRSADPAGEWRLVDTPRAGKGRGRAPAHGADPYNRLVKEARSAEPAKARSLDDMRRLSAQIQKAPTWVPPPTVASEELLVRMAGLRSRLERCLEQVNGLGKSVPQPGDLRTEGLLARLQQSGRHLQDALDELAPDPLTVKD